MNQSQETLSDIRREYCRQSEFDALPEFSTPDKRRWSGKYTRQSARLAWYLAEARRLSAPIMTARLSAVQTLRVHMRPRFFKMFSKTGILGNARRRPSIAVYVTSARPTIEAGP
jgi:hypothetical protein